MLAPRLEVIEKTQALIDQHKALASKLAAQGMVEEAWQAHQESYVWTGLIRHLESVTDEYWQGAEA